MNSMGLHLPLLTLLLASALAVVHSWGSDLEEENNLREKYAEKLKVAADNLKTGQEQIHWMIRMGDVKGAAITAKEIEGFYAKTVAAIMAEAKAEEEESKARSFAQAE